MGYNVYSKAPNEGKSQWYHWLINNAFLIYISTQRFWPFWPWLNLFDLMYFYFCMFSLFLWCAGRKSGTSGKVCGEGKYYFGSGESFQHSICPETSSFCDKQDKTLLMFFSCPGQLNRWPCHSLSEWVRSLLIHNDYNDYIDYNDYYDYSDYNNYNDYRDSNLDLDLDWERFSDLVAQLTITDYYWLIFKQSVNQQWQGQPLSFPGQLKNATNRL